MEQPTARPRDLEGELEGQLRLQERQLVGVRLAVVALALGFLLVFGEPIEGRYALMALVVGVAAYSAVIGLASARLPIRPVAAAGVILDAIAVTGVVRLATNVPDSYLFFGLVILGVAVRFGMLASVAASLVISATYFAIVVTSDVLNEFIGELLPVRILFLVTFGVVAGLFSRIISRHASENVRLQQRLEAEQERRARARERDLVTRLARDFSASFERNATERAIVTGAAAVLGDATALVLAEDDDGARLRVASVDGPDAELVGRWRSALEAQPPIAGTGVIGSALAAGSQVAQSRDDGEPRDELAVLDVAWMVVSPIAVAGRAIGAVATAGRSTNEPDPRVRRLVEAVAERAGPALQNARLWADLQDQVAREQQAQRVKDDFLSVVSHELRTPLTSIQGYSQLLEARLRGARGDSKEMAHVRVILSQVTRMRRLVDDLLDVHRMDRRGEITIEPVDFDLAELLRDAVARVRRAAPDRDIDLEVPASLPVTLDRERVDQVVSNILENAVKYSPDGGPVRLKASEHDGDVEVSVSDTGIGIPAEHREDVFERFYQGSDDASRRRFGGLGLGLAISRAIVNAHGGRIWATANDEAARGTVVIFRVPRVAKPQQPAATAGDDLPPFVKRGSAA